MKDHANRFFQRLDRPEGFRILGLVSQDLQMVAQPLAIGREHLFQVLATLRLQIVHTGHSISYAGITVAPGARGL